MASLYQKVRNLNTKSASKIAEVKRAIEEKSGTVIDYESMTTLPDEINSIKTISTVTNDLCVRKSVDAITESYLSKAEYNEKNGIFVGTFLYSNNMIVIDTNLHHEEKNYMRIVPLPANDDAAFTFKGYNGGHVLSIFSIDEYIFMRFMGAYDNKNYPITFYTTDGKIWSRDMGKIINGARNDILDIIASYPWGATVKATSGIYDYDFTNKEVRKSTMEWSGPTEMEAIVLENIAILVPRYADYVTLDTIYYVKLDDPFNIRKVSIADSYAINVKHIFSMIKTGRNTIAILLKNTNDKYIAYEMYVNITYNGAVTIDFNPIEFDSSIVLAPSGSRFNYTATSIGKYTAFDLTGDTIYYSDNMDVWKPVYTVQNSDGVTPVKILYSFYDGTYLHIIDDEIKHNLLTVAVIDAEDVPKNKVYINSTGELSRGSIGSNFSSLHATGRICNMMIDSNMLFDNKVIFDPTYHHISFNQIIYYVDSFYYLIGYKNHIMLMKSNDGYKWKCIYETTESPITFSPANYNRWRLEIIEGKLYLIQHGHGVNSYGPSKVTISPDDTVEIVSDKSICWNICDNVDSTLLQYLYNACEGVVYAKKTAVDSNEIESIIIMNRYGYTSLLSENFVVNTYLEVYNETNAIVIVGDNNFIYAKDNKVYKSKSFGINNIDPSTAQIHVYDDETLIIVQRTINDNIPFIKFFHINKADMTIDDIPNSQLPSGYDIFIRRPYLPVVVLKESHLYINDYNNKEIGLIIDLEDKFKVVRYEDNTTTHTHSSMQYCNGILFVIDSYTKKYSFYTNELERVIPWKGLCGNDKGFYSIADTEIEEYTIWYSVDGLIYTPIDGVPEDFCPDYIAGADSSVIAACNEYTNKVVIISNENDYIPSYYELPEYLYIQNVEAQSSPNGTELYVFGKLNENDPYNVIYKSCGNHSVWLEIGITTISDPTTRSVWRDITCNDDEVWVAIAANTTEIITSTDGVEWQSSTMPYDVAWDAVVSTDTMFVAVARGTDKAAYSYDGIIWEPYQLSREAEWCGVAYGKVNGIGTLTVICANSSIVLCGPDIFSLQEYDTAKNLDYVRLIYQDNKFVALARNSRYAVYSFNGIDWEYALLPVSADWRYLLYASGAFVAIDANCDNMASSINGMSWIAEAIEEGRTYRLIDYHNEKFVIFEFIAGKGNDASHETGEDNENEYGEYTVSYIGTSDTLKEWIDVVVNDYNTVIGSTDGIVVAKMGSDVNWIDGTLPLLDSELEYDWLKITSPLHEEWTGIIEHGKNKLLYTRNSNAFMVSEDYGDSWTRLDFTEDGVWSCGVYGLNRFIVFSDNNQNYQFSTDYGQTWRIDSHGITDSFSGALYHNGVIYLFSKDNATCYTTSDLENWVTRSLPQPFTKVIHTGNKFIAIVTNSSSYYISEDGYEWTANVFTNAAEYVDIAAHDNKVIVTIANSAETLYSTDDGITWSIVTLPESNSLWNVTFVDRVFIMLGKATSHNLVSIDGLNWTIGELHSNCDWAIAYHDEFAYSINRIYAVPQGLSEIGYSYDGKYWYRSSTMSKLLYGNGLYVAVDTSTENDKEVAVFYSTDCVNWYVVKVVLDGKLNDIIFGDGKFVIITDSLNTWVYESVDILNWTIRDIGFETEKRYIAHNHIGFAILTSSSVVHLIENRVRFTNTVLDTEMNQLIGESNGTVVILDYSTYSLYIGSKGSDYFTQVTNIEIDNTRNWQIFSTESSIFVTSDEDMWIFNTVRNDWFHLTYELDNSIVGIQEAYIEDKDGKIGQVGVVYTGTRLYFVRGLHDVSKDIDMEYINEESYITLPADTKGICSNVSARTILRFTTDTIYHCGIIRTQMTIDATYDDQGNQISSSSRSWIDFTTNVPYTPEIEGSIVDIAFANGVFVMITDTNKYYVSEDAIEWKEYSMIEGAVGVELASGTNFFVGTYSINEDIGYFYSENGSDISYYDFEETYGTDIDVTATPNSIYIAKYDDILTELMFYDKTILMSAAGTKENKDNFINPKKNRFVKGNFELSSTESEKYIDLDFTPRMVIVDSITKSSTDKFKHVVISSAEDIYQNIDNNIEMASNHMIVEKHNSLVTVHDTEKSRIVHNGFIFENCDLTDGTYIYYAFN